MIIHCNYHTKVSFNNGKINHDHQLNMAWHFLKDLILQTTTHVKLRNVHYDVTGRKSNKLFMSKVILFLANVSWDIPQVRYTWFASNSTVIPFPSEIWLQIWLTWKSSSLQCFSMEAFSLEAFILITKPFQISNLTLGV